MLLRILTVAAFAFNFAAAQLTITPTFDTVIDEGDSFMYKCKNGETGSNVQPLWKNPDDQTIPTLTGGGSNNLYTTEGSESSLLVTRLQFNNFEVSAEGTYKCEIGAADDTREVIFSVPITFPKQADESEQRLLYNSTTASLRCTVNSNLEPTFLWYFNGGNIQPGTKYGIPTPTDVSDPSVPTMEHSVLAVLQVHNVLNTDTGTYTCQPNVDSTGASRDLAIQVIVQVRPKWLVEPESRSAVEGTDVMIQCKASGTPDPTYTWKDDNGDVIQSSDKYLFQDNGEYFTITNLALSDDKLYTCIASNDAPDPPVVTDIEKTIRLTVVVPPTLNIQFNQTKSEASLTTMECSITRPNAEATLSWRRGGLRDEDKLVLGAQPEDSRITVTRNELSGSLTLTIDNTQRVDEGPWTCYAESLAGDVYVSHFLFVEYLPQIDRSKTPQRVITWVDNPANLTCTFDGYPVPSIKWKRLGYVLNETGRIQFLPDTPPGTSTVLINPMHSDFGGYYCEGKNSVSNDAVSNRQDLILATVPNEPLSVQITKVTSSTLQIELQPPESDGGLEILYYDVSFWVQYDSTDTIQQFDNYTDVVLTGLAGQSLYIVRVAAVNEMGRGTYSNNVSATTEDHAVPNKPKITSLATSNKYQEYDLTWEPPMDDGGADISTYTIRYAQVDGPDSTSLGPRFDEYDVPGDAIKSTISKLNQGMYYRIELTATNSIGEGDFADITVKMAGGYNFQTTPANRPQQNLGTLGTTQIVAIVVAVFVILLILVDVCCFCMNGCGLTMFICVQCFGKTSPSTKDEIEMGQEDYGDFYEDDLDLEDKKAGRV